MRVNSAKRPAAVLNEILGDAPNAVAAHLAARAVGVVHFHATIGINAGIGRTNKNEAVRSHAAMTVTDGPGQGGAINAFQRFAIAIDIDVVVAQSVHLRKRELSHWRSAGCRNLSSHRSYRRPP